MNEILMIDRKPSKGQRVLVDDGKEIVSASVLDFLPGRPFILTDNGGHFAFTDIKRWWEMPKY